MQGPRALKGFVGQTDLESMRVLCSTFTLAALILSVGGVAFRPADPAHAGEVEPSTLGFTPIHEQVEAREAGQAEARAELRTWVDGGSELDPVTEERTRRRPPVGVCSPDAPAKGSETIALDPRRLHARAAGVVPLSGRGYNYRPPSPLFPKSPLSPNSAPSPSPRDSQKPRSP